MVVLLWLGAAVFIALTAIGPKRLYWATQAPFQRNPEATEPSDLAYGLGYLVNGSIALVLTVAALVSTVHSVTAYSTSRMMTIARNAGDAIADDPTTASEEDLVVPVIKGQGSIRVGVPHDSAQGEQYELTNSGGHNPVCLTVALDQPPGTLVADRTVIYRVTAGRCPTG